MPFGLGNVAPELQRQVNRYLPGAITEGSMVFYMYHVLVFSRSVQEHLDDLTRALEHLREKQ